MAGLKEFFARRVGGFTGKRLKKALNVLAMHFDCRFNTVNYEALPQNQVMAQIYPCFMSFVMIFPKSVTGPPEEKTC